MSETLLKPGMDLLFQEPGLDERRFRRATLRAVEEELLRVDFVDAPLGVALGQELVVFFHGEDEFLQQVVRVVATDRERVQLVRLGNACSAEAREHGRISTPSASLFASMGEERELEVQDVSSTGFAVVARGSYPIGTTFPIALQHHGDLYSGIASIQSVRELRPGRVRYGLRALVDREDSGDLADGLQRISDSLQSGPELKPGF